MGCNHETVTVYTEEAVRQDYDRTKGVWGDMDHDEIIALRQIICAECGEDLTAELHEEISEAF